MSRHQRLEREEPLADPVVHPTRNCRVVRAVIAAQPVQYPQIVDRVDVRADEARHAAHDCSRCGRRRQQRRLRPAFIEIFDDRGGLDEDAVLGLEGRH
jgi:hypothetical protein